MLDLPFYVERFIIHRGDSLRYGVVHFPRRMLRRSPRVEHFLKRMLRRSPRVEHFPKKMFCRRSWVELFLWEML